MHRNWGLLLVLAVGTAGCGDQLPGGKACTALFATITLRVNDANGDPAAGVTITDTILRTHQGFTVPSEGFPLEAGQYIIFSDNYISRIRERGDSVRVTGVSSAGRFSQDYVFDLPDGCHVHKALGPDTVVLQ
jgi:hypothetical protein